MRNNIKKFIKEIQGLPGYESMQITAYVHQTKNIVGMIGFTSLFRYKYTVIELINQYLVNSDHTKVVNDGDKVVVTIYLNGFLDIRNRSKYWKEYSNPEDYFQDVQNQQISNNQN